MVREFSREEVARDNAAFTLLSSEDQDTWMRLQTFIWQNRVAKDSGNALNTTAGDALQAYAEPEITRDELGAAYKKIPEAKGMLERLGKIKESLSDKPIGRG